MSVSIRNFLPPRSQDVPCEMSVSFRAQNFPWFLTFLCSQCSHLLAKGLKACSPLGPRLQCLTSFDDGRSFRRIQKIIDQYGSSIVYYKYQEKKRIQIHLQVIEINSFPCCLSSCSDSNLKSKRPLVRQHASFLIGFPAKHDILDIGATNHRGALFGCGPPFHPTTCLRERFMHDSVVGICEASTRASKLDTPPALHRNGNLH